MSTRELRDNYLLFIGAGCVATAGIISMFRTMPMIVRSIRSGLGQRGGRRRPDRAAPAVRRTENDMSMKTVLCGSLGLIVLLATFLAGRGGDRQRGGRRAVGRAVRVPVRDRLRRG